MEGHFILKCSECGDIVSQCRCMDHNKTVEKTICAKCKQKALNEEADKFPKVPGPEAA